MAGSRRIDANATGKRKYSSGGSEEGTAGKKQCLSYSGMSTVLIKVGPEETQYHVHCHKLCQVSSFFKKALESGFKEGKERVISLPCERAEIVDRFVQWIYHEKVPDCDASPSGTKRGKSKSPHRNCDLYIFADKYGIPDLKRYAMGNLIQLIGKYRPPSPSMVKTAYDLTVPSSGLRRFLCNWCVWTISDDLGSEDCRALLIEVPEFSADLVGALSRHWERKSMPKIDSLRVNAYM